MRNAWIQIAARTVSVAAIVTSLIGCAADGMGTGDGPLVGADDTNTAQITASYPIGSTLQTTGNLNLRTGPSTSNHVLLVIPSGSRVVTIDVTAPQNGFYKVRYGSTSGFSSGTYLRFISAPATDPGTAPGGTTDPDAGTPTGTDPDAGAPTGTGTGTGSTALDTVFQRAVSGVGFAYWWGHGSWLDTGPTASTQSTCSGSCPSCSHAGSYGADCSGFVAKVWNVPSSNTTLSNDSHPYSTVDFFNSTGGGQWSAINRSDARHGDALVYNTGTAGHIFLVDSGDPWGSLWVYEAPGCASGGGRIHHTLRTASSAYHGIRRAGL